MATRAFAAPAEREARFYLIMACVMAVTIIAGFTLNLSLGRSSFAVPLLVHIHAVTMMGWVGLYVLQNTLFFTRNIPLHKRLGWLSMLWLPTILVTGLAMIRYSLQTHGGPFFFAQNEFLFSNPLLLILTVALAFAAVAVRRNTGWHRRLMYCSFALLTGPGVGRLAPNPYLIPWAWWIGSVVPTLLFIGIAAVADKRRTGHVHPAWIRVGAAILVVQIVADLVAYSAWGISFTQAFVAGTPGAERPMEAFIPPGVL